MASSQDLAEFFNALIGHPFDPSARPLTRGFVWFVGATLAFLYMPLELYYWMKQCVLVTFSLLLARALD